MQPISQGETTTPPVPIVKPLTRFDIFKQATADNRLCVYLSIDLATLINLEGIDALNDYADNQMLGEDVPGCLSDISYTLAGTSEWDVLVWVNADITDTLDEITCTCGNVVEEYGKGYCNLCQQTIEQAHYETPEVAKQMLEARSIETDGAFEAPMPGE